MPYCPRCGSTVNQEGNLCVQCTSKQTDSNEVKTKSRSDIGYTQDVWYWTVVLASAGWLVLLFGFEAISNGVFTLVLFASWIGVPVGIYYDSKTTTEALDWPKYRWLYILGSLIWVFAVIPGAIYAWKRHSLTEETVASEQVEPSQTEIEGQKERLSTSGISYSFSIESDDYTSAGEEYTPEELLAQSTGSWIQPGNNVTVKEFDISDGMVYVGENLTGLDKLHSTDCALINPTLDIDTSNLDPQGRRMSYYPSYTDIDAGCRATYLKWLANGRRNPDISIGYVFLFFYGIERRVLFDAEHSEEARAEIPELLSEVAELLDVYDEDNSFSSYATSLLEVARAKYDPKSLETTSEDGHYRRLPIGLQIRIGRHLDQGRPLTAELAYEWFKAHPNTYRRTPARRCESEFKSLFLSKFKDWYGDGWSMEPPEESLTVSYRAASRSIPKQEDIEVDGVPDITGMELPREKFQELAHECCEELDEYSRYIARNEERESLEAMSLLPTEILEEKQEDSVTALMNDIEEELRSSDMANIELDLILRHFWKDSSTEVRKNNLRRVVTLLDKLGYGLEPDPRFSSPGRGWGDPAVVFRLPENAGYDSSEVTPSIRLIQRLAMKVALANDDFAPEQTEYLSENLGKFLELNQGDFQRLQAHRQWLILDTPTLHGVRQRAEDFSEEQSVRVGRFLTALAASDGKIDQTEIEELRKIYPMIGLEETLVGEHLDELRTQANIPEDDPVTIREGEPTDEYQIPDPPESDKERAEIELDSDRVAKRLEESKEVSKFLGDIFEEQDGDESQTKAANQGDVGNSVVELEDNHKEFLSTLLEQSEWGREELETISREHGLFPDAAIEVINEYAYEEFEAPVLKGTDVIEVDQDRGEELIS